MSSPTRAVLVPPRPNLGPDPLPSSRPSNSTLAAIGVASMFVFLLALWLRRRRKSRRRLVSDRPPLPRPVLIEPSSSRDWMIVWSDNVREVLVDRFGPAWRAKTTEEISSDERVTEVLGAEQAETLREFLNEVDHIKFASDGDSTWTPDDRRTDEWKPWVAAFVATPRADVPKINAK